MPKIVDHEERRRELAQALWRVIARDGMTGASARAVAVESGWSLGAVRHYFSTQGGLYRFAGEQMMAATTARVVAAMTQGQPGRQRAQRALEHLLPLDEERAGEVQAWLALLVHARVDPELDDLRRQAMDDERRLCRAVVAELAGRDAGRVGEGAFDERLEGEALRLQALIDGLTVQGATWPEGAPPQRLRAVLARHLDDTARRLAGPAR